MMCCGRMGFYRKQKCTNKARSITWKAVNKTTIHPENIAWIKNVKVKSGKGWAYDEYSCGQTFKLHWPTSKRGSAETPKRDDLILLFQKPDNINGKKNYKVHLTHIVQVTSDEASPDEENPNHKWFRWVKIIAIANPIEAIPNPGYYNFFKPNRGLTNPIKNLGNTIELTDIEVLEDILYLFAPFLCSEYQIKEKYSDIIGQSFEALEGDKHIREHVRLEKQIRDSSIVRIAKKRALTSDNGRIKCECCGFDFVEYYGPLGLGFMECHHKIPLAKGKRITKVTDLALVCSNCHRMLHKKIAENQYHTIESLKELIINQRSAPNNG